MRHATSRMVKSMLGACAIALSLAVPATAQKADPKWDAWLKQSQLGPYQKDENWDDVVAKAKKEGELVVYASAGVVVLAAGGLIAWRLVRR